MIVDLRGNDYLQAEMGAGFLSKIFPSKTKKKIRKATGEIIDTLLPKETPGKIKTVKAAPMPEEKTVFGIPQKILIPAGIGAGVLLLLALKKRG